VRVLLLKALFHILSWLPLRVSHALGAAIGWLFAVIPNKRRRTAEVNLKLCFPEMQEHARVQLARRHLMEFGKAITETAVLWTRNAEEFGKLVHKVSGEELVKNAMRHGKGLILAMPHLGAWELVSLYCSRRYPLTTMYRTPPMSAFGNMMRAARERFGARLVSGEKNGIRALYRALENGEMVAILPDQVPASRSGAVHAPFFGIPASTMVLLSRLAMKTQAPVIFAYAERLPRGRGYHVRFLLGQAGINGRDLERSVAQVNAMVEQCVRELPEQYQWVYKRFRNQPKGEKAHY
jgi:KDO2-lipid IV(A) lauroyltransferase